MWKTGLYFFGVIVVCILLAIMGIILLDYHDDAPFCDEWAKVLVPCITDSLVDKICLENKCIRICTKVKGSDVKVCHEP